MKVADSIETLTEANVDAIARMENGSIHHRTTGERIADLVTKWVGSWTFLIIQTTILVVWIILNLSGYISIWDPYPFVLLNLALSFQAAYATPFILMSENRQAKLSERRNQLDLQVNLLAEQENTEQLKLLRLLCEKLAVEIPKADKRLEDPVQPESIIRQIIQREIDPARF